MGIRVGLIGCGLTMRMKHMVVLPSVAGIEVVAACDVDERALQTAADEFHIARRYADAHALFADDGVDAVAICTPPDSHAELTLAALDAGKHVLVEKPLTLDVDECDRLIERARCSDRRVLVGHHMRHHRQILHARRQLKAGALGEVELVRAVWSHPLRLVRDLPSWRGERATGGGSLIEEGVHLFDLWACLGGAGVEEVYAASRSPRWPDETVTLSARLANGVLISAMLSEVSGCDLEVEIYGRKGRLRLACLRWDGIETFMGEEVPGGLKSSLGRIARSLAMLPQGAMRGRRGGDYMLSYREQWVHFVDMVANGAPSACTLEDGRHAVQVALAAVESARSGKPVHLAGGPRRVG